MYVQKIHIKTFRHLENVDVGPFPLPPKSSDTIVLAGPNGGGKSSILELLGYALSNTWSLSWALSRSFPTNSFEVALAVTPDERELIRNYIATTPEGTYSDEVKEYVAENFIYYRAYNFEEGEYQRRAPLYNQIHGLVTQALRNEYARSLGFFLKSDRSYPVSNFRRERLFEYENIIRRDHIWSMAFDTSDIQYQDMFEFLLQQRYHYYRRLGEHHHKTAKGIIGSNAPADPLEPYDSLLSTLFPGYAFSESSEEIPTNLFIKIPSGETVPFRDLSSGEKEVFFILSFFVRHNVSNAVIVVDEPELHLHPELGRLLVRTMQSIRPGNQIWLATHNPEIVDEVGRDRVVYVTRDSATFKSKVTKGTDEPEALKTLKDMFGYSGYVGISKRMVFLEGAGASSDRKVFANIFPEYGNIIKFIPANSSSSQSRINAAIMSILEVNLGWADFYLLRDRDFLPDEFVNKYNGHPSKRIYVFKRHEIENYLLVDELIAKVQSEIYGVPKTSEEVRDRMVRVALKMSGEVLREIASFRLNLLFQPEDFSLGKIFQGQELFSEHGAVDEAKINTMETTLANSINPITANLTNQVSGASLRRLLDAYVEEIRIAMFEDGDGWRTLFPGKELLENYAKSAGLGDATVFTNSLIKELSASKELVPSELAEIVRKVGEGESLHP